MKDLRHFTTIVPGLLAGILVSGMAHAGMLTASHTNMPEGSIVNLIEEGLLDWVHWCTRGASSADHDFMAGVDRQISDYTRIGSGTVLMFNHNFTGYSWTNGTPTPRLTNSTTGIFMVGKVHGFEISVPADTTPKLLAVHVGAYGARMHLEAVLSDHSAPPYLDESYQNPWLGPNRVYAFQFAADSPGPTLIVKFWTITMYEAEYGNVTLQSATLSRLPAIDSPTLHLSRLGQSLVLSWPASTTGYQLENAAEVGAAASWTTAATAPVVIGDEQVVTVDLGTGAQFFRFRVLGGRRLRIAR